MSGKCDELENQTKEFSSNLNELKRQPANSVGHVLRWRKDKIDEHLQRFSISFLVEYLKLFYKIYSHEVLPKDWHFQGLFNEI